MYIHRYVEQAYPACISIKGRRAKQQWKCFGIAHPANINVNMEVFIRAIEDTWE